MLDLVDDFLISFTSCYEKIIYCSTAFEECVLGKKVIPFNWFFRPRSASRAIMNNLHRNGLFVIFESCGPPRRL